MFLTAICDETVENVSVAVRVAKVVFFTVNQTNLETVL